MEKQCCLTWTTGMGNKNFSDLEGISDFANTEEIKKIAKLKQKEELNKNPRRLGSPREWKVIVGDNEFMLS